MEVEVMRGYVYLAISGTRCTQCGLAGFQKGDDWIRKSSTSSYTRSVVHIMATDKFVLAWDIHVCGYVYLAISGTRCTQCGLAGFQKGDDWIRKSSTSSYTRFVVHTMTTGKLVLAWDIHECASMRSNDTVACRVESIRSFTIDILIRYVLSRCCLCWWKL